MHRAILILQHHAVLHNSATAKQTHVYAREVHVEATKFPGKVDVGVNAYKPRTFNDIAVDIAVPNSSVYSPSIPWCQRSK